MSTSLPTYSPLENLHPPKPISRIAHIKNGCKDKTVLDLGAMDETAYAAKLDNGLWLHAEIARTAKRVIGVDSSTLLPAEGISTGGNAHIHRLDIGDLHKWLDSQPFKAEVVVAGELIEHVENPLSFLRLLRNIDALRGADLFLSTPNATAIHNCLIGLSGRESTHHDHLCILSYKTLCTLMHRAGFEEWTITPYFSDFAEMRGRNSGIRRRLVDVGQRCINTLEWLFPLMSFGYVVQTRL